MDEFLIGVQGQFIQTAFDELCASFNLGDGETKSLSQPTDRSAKPGNTQRFHSKSLSNKNKLHRSLDDALQTATRNCGHRANRSTDNPIMAYRTGSPVMAYHTDSPVTAYRTDSPVMAYHTDSPVTAYRTDSPVTAYRTDSPVTAYCTDSPVMAYRTDLLAQLFDAVCEKCGEWHRDTAPCQTISLSVRRPKRRSPNSSRTSLYAKSGPDCSRFRELDENNESVDVTEAPFDGCQENLMEKSSATDTATIGMTERGMDTDTATIGMTERGMDTDTATIGMTERGMDTSVLDTEPKVTFPCSLSSNAADGQCDERLCENKRSEVGLESVGPGTACSTLPWLQREGYALRPKRSASVIRLSEGNRETVEPLASAERSSAEADPVKSPVIERPYGECCAVKSPVIERPYGECSAVKSPVIERPYGECSAVKSFETNDCDSDGSSHSGCAVRCQPTRKPFGQDNTTSSGKKTTTKERRDRLSLRKRSQHTTINKLTSSSVTGSVCETSVTGSVCETSVTGLVYETSATSCERRRSTRLQRADLGSKPFIEDTRAFKKTLHKQNKTVSKAKKVLLAKSNQKIDTKLPKCSPRLVPSGQSRKNSNKKDTNVNSSWNILKKKSGNKENVCRNHGKKCNSSKKTQNSKKVTKRKSENQVSPLNYTGYTPAMKKSKTNKITTADPPEGAILTNIEPTEKFNSDNMFIPQFEESFSYGNTWLSLTHLEHSGNTHHLLESSRNGFGRQTRTSEGLDNLLRSCAHPGGIWQSIVTES